MNGPARLELWRNIKRDTLYLLFLFINWRKHLLCIIHLVRVVSWRNSYCIGAILEKWFAFFSACFLGFIRLNLWSHYFFRLVFLIENGVIILVLWLEFIQIRWHITIFLPQMKPNNILSSIILRAHDWHNRWMNLHIPHTILNLFRKLWIFDWHRLSSELLITFTLRKMYLFSSIITFLIFIIINFLDLLRPERS